MRFALVLITVMLLSGCAHRFTQEQVDLAIVKGKTTEKDVLRLFGPPDRITKASTMKMSSGEKEVTIQKPREVWSYSTHKLKLLDVLESDTMKIVFDEKGVVLYYDFRVDD